MKVILFDINPDMVKAWEKEFYLYQGHAVHPVSVQQTAVDILLKNNQIDGLVSPANSFGFMDGGIDGVYSRLIPGIQDRVQKTIKSDHFGEIPVGVAAGVQTGLANPYEVICAPTMRTPSGLCNELAINCYLATKAVFQVSDDFYGDETVIAIPGMGTGVGGLPKDYVAAAMRQAYEDVLITPVVFPKTLSQAAMRHHELMNKFNLAFGQQLSETAQ